MVYSSVGAVHENGPVANLSQACGKALRLKHGTLALSIYADRRALVLKQDYTFLQGFANPMRATSRVWRAFKQPESFDTTNLDNLDEFMSSNFRAVEDLKVDLAGAS